MNKHLNYVVVLFLLFLTVSCVTEKIETQEDRASYNPEAVWEYNGDNSVLKGVIQELKNGPNSASLERRLQKNDVLWENAEFILVENKKRIFVPFLSVDKENIIGFFALYRDAKKKIQFDMTVRSDLYKKEAKLPFWTREIWAGHFLAYDRTLLGIKNGNPGLMKKALTPQESKNLSAKTADLVCFTTSTETCISFSGGDTTYVIGEGQTGTHNEAPGDYTFCNTSYDVTCFDTGNEPPTQTDPSDNSGGGGNGSGGSGVMNIPTFILTPKITNLKKELECFNQNVGAKLTIYANQSIIGSRELTANIGHTFITITQNGVTRSLGFYPDSPNASLLSSQTSEIHDNSRSDYDVSITINISASQLENVIDYITAYPDTYDLNNFNCTDFGIKVMSLGGLALPKTIGSYSFLFKGRNPSDLAEDMRDIQLPAGATRDQNSGKAPAKSGTCN